jgi:hypothetical protein
LLEVFLVKTVQRALFSFLDRLLDPGNRASPGFGQKNMRLPGVLRRVGFGKKPLRLQPQDCFGDGGRANADFGGERAGGLSVLPRQCQHQLVLTCIQVLLQKPGGENCAPESRGMVKLLYDLPVLLRHFAYLPSQQAALRACNNQANDAGK